MRVMVLNEVYVSDDNVCESLSMSSARLSVGLKQGISPPLAWLSSSLVMLEDACMRKAVHVS